MSEQEKNNTKKKTPKREYGFMDLSENTEKWIKVMVVAGFILVLSFIGSRIYDTYIATDCGEGGCALNERERIELLSEKLEAEVENTGQEVFINEEKYSLYKTEEEYLLTSWEPVFDEGDKIKTIETGIEEKELIPTGEKAEYLIVWGEDEERLLVYEDGVETKRYEKLKNQVQIIELMIEDTEKVEFKK